MYSKADNNIMIQESSGTLHGFNSSSVMHTLAYNDEKSEEYKAISTLPPAQSDAVSSLEVPQNYANNQYEETVSLNDRMLIN